MTREEKEVFLLLRGWHKNRPDLDCWVMKYKPVNEKDILYNRSFLSFDEAFYAEEQYGKSIIQSDIS
jgi:hypothetical protein